MQYISHQVCSVHVYMCLCLQVCEREQKKKKSGRINALIRGVQVQPSHFECASEGEKSARYCAGLLLKAATTPT